MEVPEVTEVAYRNRPPLLEDASIRGPTRTPIRDAMLTLEERDAIEADYRWYRYSKFAFPWLIYIIALGVAVFCLTAWQQVGGYKRFSAARAKNLLLPNGARARQGLPRYITTIDETKADLEAGLPKTLRNIRIATVFIGAVGIMLIFLVLCCKPRPKARMALSLCLVLFLIATSVLAWIGFGWGIKRVGDAKQCPWNYQQTNEKCISRKGHAIIAIVLDGAIGLGAFVSAILLVLYSISGDWRLQRTGWRERERDLETEMKKQKDPEHLRLLNIRKVRRTLLTIFLLFTLISLIILAIFIILLHLDHDKIRLTSVDSIIDPANQRLNNGRGIRGVDMDKREGWPDRNTRLRYAFASIAVGAGLLSLIPFTHRAIAYIFCFIFFVDAVIGYVVFAFDMVELRNAKNQCQIDRPTGTRCIYAPYVATSIIEFFLAFSLTIYVFYEFCIKCCCKSRYSRRQYAAHEKSKHDTYLDSLRPVRDEVTGRVMTAKEYVYRWRFVAGTDAATYVPPFAGGSLLAPPLGLPPPIYSQGPVIV
jgi:hypothetical protein